MGPGQGSQVRCRQQQCDWCRRGIPHQGARPACGAGAGFSQVSQVWVQLGDDGAGHGLAAGDGGGGSLAAQWDGGGLSRLAGRLAAGLGR